MGDKDSIAIRGKYKHLSFKERVTIETMLKLGKTKSEIADNIQKNANKKANNMRL